MYVTINTCKLITEKCTSTLQSIINSSKSYSVMIIDTVNTRRDGGRQEETKITKAGQKMERQKQQIY
ncbi:hypothetical protein RRG08_016915 [Elysia crispata]|uniref:Uncharacterized protein n=1 Tax=Elysia crispata TaxID=231223 RepID=A0AAE1DI69_9GAST|nr:hypothetical protein RRG08_016915 [Elysia crispata]